MADLSEVLEKLQAARAEAERLECGVARYEAQDKWNAVSNAVLNDKSVCEILKSISTGEAEVFANCVVQNMKAPYEACAQSRADVRKHEAELVDLILKYYVDLSEKYRKMIPLKMVYIPVPREET